MFPKKNELNLRISDGFTAVESLAGVTGATPSLPLRLNICNKTSKKEIPAFGDVQTPFYGGKVTNVGLKLHSETVWIRRYDINVDNYSSLRISQL